MARGRCAGCGYEDLNCKKVNVHTASCPDFLKLFRSDPDAALDPEAEYARVRAAAEADPDAEVIAREERRASTAARYKAENDAKVALQQERFSQAGSVRFNALHATSTSVPVPEGGTVPTRTSTPGHRVAARHNGLTERTAEEYRTGELRFEDDTTNTVHS